MGQYCAHDVSGKLSPFITLGDHICATRLSFVKKMRSLSQTFSTLDAITETAFLEWLLALIGKLCGLITILMSVSRTLLSFRSSVSYCKNTIRINFLG